MLALIADYGTFRKNIGGLGAIARVRMVKPIGRRPVLKRLPGGLWGLGYAAADTVQYCNVPGVGLTACAGQDLGTMQCHRMVDDENARRTVNLTDCLQASSLNKTSPAPCHAQYDPVSYSTCAGQSTIGGNPSLVNAGGFSYVTAPAAPPAPVAQPVRRVSPRIPLSLQPVQPVQSTTDTPAPVQGGIQPGATPGVTTNPPANVTPGGTMPVDTGIIQAPGSTGTDIASTIGSFLTQPIVAGIPLWVIAAGVGVGALAMRGGR